LRRAWQGISGAAVFEKAGALVGVIVAHGDTVNIRRMLPIARLFGQHGALTALSQAGVPPLRQAPRCPEGVVPLGGEETPTRGLRDYLRQGRLPYYSRSRHLAAHEAAVEDEEALLVELAGHEKPGIIVTGIGGVGKTRLSLELGRRAHHRGWPVYRVSPSAKPSSKELRELTGSDPERPVLLIFDYFERTPRFIEIPRQLDDLFDEPQNLRFVANCRHSFYEVSDTVGGVRNRLVEISDEEPWEGYLEAVTSLSPIRPTLSKTKTCENFAKVGLRLRSC
jgi:hypothetical protein